MKQYIDLLNDIIENGKHKPNRTGNDTISVFGRMLRFNLQDGFPLLTTKKIHTKSVIGELLWFLGNHMSDDRYKNLPMMNIKYLKDNGISIWDEWSDENGDLNRIYGIQWKEWRKYNTDESGNTSTSKINQIDNIISDLKNNYDSRRMLVSAWNVSDLDEMNLPPCHYAWQVYSEPLNDMERHNLYLKWVNENGIDDSGMSNDDAMEHYKFPKRKLSLLFNMRSVDVPLGLPFNIASYAFLTHMLANVTNHCVGDLICSLGDTHIYLNQIDGIKEQIQREPRNLPRLLINKNIKNIYDYKIDDFKILDYDPHPSIKMPVSV